MEQVKQVIAWELLFILVFSSLIIISSAGNLSIRAITGHAIAGVTNETVLADLQAALPQFDVVQKAGDFTMCLIVNIDSETKYSYDVIKIGQAVAVTQSDTPDCKGPQNEDFIVSYISYDKLKAELDSKPSLTQLMKEGDGTDFYLYPSKQILSGGILSDPQTFNQNFGTVLNELPASQVNDILSAKSPQTQSPSASLASYFIYFALGLVVLVIIISVLVFSRSKKPSVEQDLQLVAYIKSSLAQGYPQDQIMQSLLQSGWKQDKINDAFKSATAEVSMQGFQ